MYNNKHTFHCVDPSLESFRVLYDFEKESIIEELKISKIPIYSISINDWRCVSMKCKVDDIICIKNHLIKFYRRVIP
jgi:hypothetical protein